MNSSIQRPAALPLPSQLATPQETPRLGIPPQAIPRGSADAPADLRPASAARTGWILAIALLFACFGLSPAWALQVGDRIRTTGEVNVRPSAGGTPAYSIGQPAGAVGVIKAGPADAKIGGTGSTYIWWRIDFDNGQDGWVAGINLAAFSPPSPALRIDRVDPQPLVADSGNTFQTVTVYGSNFDPLARVLLTWRGEPGHHLAANRITVVSRTEMRLSLRLGAEADNWTVRIVNPDGQVSNVKAFAVLAPVWPAPVIATVEPQPLVADPANGFQTVTLRGSNFRNGAGIELDWRDVSGRTLESSQIQVISSAEIRISIRLGREADDWAVRVINSDGQRSNKRAFRVDVPAKPAPTIDRVDPQPLVADAGNPFQTVTISGSNYDPLARVVLTWRGEPGHNLSASRITVISRTEMRLSLRLGAEADNWTVRIVNPDGQASNVKAFAVLAPVWPAPVIASVEPQPLLADPANGFQTVTLRGSNFRNGAGIELDWTDVSGWALEASRIQVVSSTEIRILIRLGREADDWAVRVINPDGQRSEKAFRVEAAAKPAPLLQSVDQEPVVADPANGYQDIGLRGTNLEDVVGVILGWTGQPEYVLSPTRIRVISGFEVAISVKLGGEADQWTAQVIHRDGRRSNVIRFEVIAEVIPPVLHALRISAENGSVSTTPALQEFEHGTDVTLHATPAAGFEFSGWEGGITGSENPVTVTMDQDLDITARFVALPSPGQLSVVGFRDGLVDLILLGSVGRSYRIEGSEDLTHWESLKTVVVPASGRAEFSLGVGDLAHFFFQAELER